MLAVDLGSADARERLHQAAARLGAHELFYVYCTGPAQLDDERRRGVLACLQRTSKGVVAAPVEALEDPAWLLALAPPGVAVRLPLDESGPGRYLGGTEGTSGDRALLERYEALRARLGPGVSLAAEVSFRRDTRLVGPTLYELLARGAPWVAVVPDAPLSRPLVDGLRDAFEYLRIRGHQRHNVYFPFTWDDPTEWLLKTRNTFSSLREVHVDVSNRCTHSCTFCGLYSPAAVDELRQRGGGRILPRYTEFMRAQLDRAQCLAFLDGLPETVRLIQFGGAGDPLLHRDAVAFIRHARARGFRVEVLSNMEYLEEADLPALHEVGGRRWEGLHIIANVSAATEETYLRTRPRQTARSFAKVLRNIERLSALRRADGGIGVSFTLMCVTTTENYRDAAAYVRLAARLGVEEVWFKPLEVHAAHMYRLMPGPDALADYAGHLAAALAEADQRGIRIMEREVVERLVRSASAASAPSSPPPEVSIGVADGGDRSDLYAQIPCTVGYSYVRLEVTGAVRACCIAKHPIGSLADGTLEQIWSSGAYAAFRDKLWRIADDRFHLRDPEWAFCQQCSHRTLNVRNHEQLSRPTPDGD